MYLAVEHPRSAGGPGNCRRHLGGGRGQGRAPGEVTAAADANSGESRIEVVAVEVQEAKQEGARVHLAGLLLKIPFWGVVVDCCFEVMTAVRRFSWASSWKGRPRRGAENGRVGRIIVVFSVALSRGAEPRRSSQKRTKEKKKAAQIPQRK